MSLVGKHRDPVAAKPIGVRYAAIAGCQETLADTPRELSGTGGWFGDAGVIFQTLASWKSSSESMLLAFPEGNMPFDGNISGARSCELGCSDCKYLGPAAETISEQQRVGATPRCNPEEGRNNRRWRKCRALPAGASEMMH